MKTILVLAASALFVVTINAQTPATTAPVAKSNHPTETKATKAPEAKKAEADKTMPASKSKKSTSKSKTAAPKTEVKADVKK